jgi:hypothetical protein
MSSYTGQMPDGGTPSADSSKDAQSYSNTMSSLRSSGVRQMPHHGDASRPRPAPTRPLSVPDATGFSTSKDETSADAQPRSSAFLHITKASSPGPDFPARGDVPSDPVIITVPTNAHVPDEALYAGSSVWPRLSLQPPTDSHVPPKLSPAIISPGEEDTRGDSRCSPSSAPNSSAPLVPATSTPPVAATAFCPAGTEAFIPIVAKLFEQMAIWQRLFPVQISSTENVTDPRGDFPGEITADSAGSPNFPAPDVPPKLIPVQTPSTETVTEPRGDYPGETTADSAGSPNFPAPDVPPKLISVQTPSPESVTEPRGRDYSRYKSRPPRT